MDNMNQPLTTLLSIWGSFLATVLAILKIIESKKRLTVFIELKQIYYETETGDCLKREIQVKIINRTIYQISIQNIHFFASRYYFIIPFKLRSIRFLPDDEIGITLFKPGESKMYKYDMSNMFSDGTRNIDILKTNKLKNNSVRARIVYPDNSTSDSRKGILINSILSD
jgi:hypothetical protein